MDNLLYGQILIALLASTAIRFHFVWTINHYNSGYCRIGHPGDNVSLLCVCVPEPCPDNCTSCDRDSGVCFACHDGYQYATHTQGFYVNSNGNCSCKRNIIYKLCHVHATPSSEENSIRSACKVIAGLHTHYNIKMMFTTTRKKYCLVFSHFGRSFTCNAIQRNNFSDVISGLHVIGQCVCIMNYRFVNGRMQSVTD